MEVAKVLGEWQAVFRQGKLQLSNHIEGLQDLPNRLTAALLGVFHFHMCTDSRWVSVGNSCSSLLASLALGLDHLVAACMASPPKGTAMFYLKGYMAKFSQDARLDGTVAAMASPVADRVLLSLLKDDRLAKRMDKVQAAMTQELAKVQGTPGHIFDLALEASGIQGLIAAGLRTKVCLVAQASVAFMCRRLAPAQELPWCLLSGDVQGNINELALAPAPTDGTAYTIWKLLQEGWDRDQLVAAINLMGEVRWSTTVVEQAHGSAAMVHRHHKHYSSEMMVR